jgi:fatty-acyl-CoA synthase
MPPPSHPAWPSSAPTKSLPVPIADTRPHAAAWPARLPLQLQVPDTTLWFNLEVSAKRYPHKAAYVFFGEPLTFAQLHGQALALAGWLQAHGVVKGDRVLLLMQNCPQFVVAFYAVQRADAVVVPVNPMNRADELAHVITDPQARVALTTADLAHMLMQANAGLPAAQQLQHVLATRLGDALPAHLRPGATQAAASGHAAQDDPTPDEPTPDEPTPDEPTGPLLQWLQADPPLPAGVHTWASALAAGHVATAPLAVSTDLALLPYTSGTTGMPKGCIHNHRSLMHNAVGGALWGYASAETISLGVVPMFHITGMMYGVISSVYLGSTVVLLPRWDRELAGRLISRHRVSHWTCIPTMIIDLFGSPNYQQFDLSSLRYLSGGGAAMPQAVAERLQTEFGLTFAEGYGLTETAAPSHANPPERAKLQCLGIPIFGVDSRVVDPQTLQEMPNGETGEIVTHGPMVFQGYWGHPDATEAAFIQIDGKAFFRTGDLGRRDDEGYFFITDRLKRMINASGYKVWPSEVELLMFKCPLVQEACVIASRDAYRGETVKAVVVLRANVKATATAEDITTWCREHMAAYKVPRLVEFVDALPKSGSGKVMWRMLQEREMAAG